ncbi:sigma-70 family RNA polymerase sigma factor [Streptomyces sp. NPDC005728]|uniref:sigma-70 family RNA polymerase sigma factor n=1 Tax=Streptomyces sp. NPDC005728 TaxID=3157054 RepID=UPI0033D380DB
MADDHHQPPSDAELTGFLTDPGSSDWVEKLHRRHRSAVLSYAYACCRDPRTAEDLTSEAFARALQTVRSGSGPKAAWRPYLLTVVRRTAADWADTTRRSDLSPEFQRWLAQLPEGPGTDSSAARMLLLEEGSLVLRAFRSLPERRQTALWHTVVEGDPARSVGLLLGAGEGDVATFAERAREGLRETCLAALDDHAGSDACRRYRPMLGAVVRTGRRSTEDFDRHLVKCPRCRGALTELTDLDEELGPALSAAVLLWGSRAYTAARMTEAGVRAAGASRASTAPEGGARPDGRTAWRSWAGGFPLRSGAVAGGIVAAIGLAVLALPLGPDGRGTERSSTQTQAVPTRTVVAEPPPVTVTARPSRPAPSRPAEQSTAAASPTAPAGPAASHRARLGAVTWAGTLRNAGFGTQCVEPSGTTVVQNSCDGRRDQIWETVSFDQNRGYSLLRNAATGECVDYGGGQRRVRQNAENLALTTGPCRPSGAGQLFRFEPFQGADDGSFLVRAEADDGKPWDEMQLGMLDWWEGNTPPATNAGVVLTYNYYNSPRLRYFAQEPTYGPAHAASAPAGATAVAATP